MGSIRLAEISKTIAIKKADELLENLIKRGKLSKKIIFVIGEFKEEDNNDLSYEVQIVLKRKRKNYIIHDIKDYFLKAILGISYNS